MANYDHYTELAIKSIFLGARIHDASALCSGSAGQMRERFHLTAKKRNPSKYTALEVEALNNGYNSVPSNYIQDSILDFFSFEEVCPNFLYESFDEMSKVQEYLGKSLAYAAANLAIQRARRDAFNGVMRVVKNKS